MARMTPLRIPPLTQMKIPRGIGIDPPTQMAPQLVQRPAPRPIPRPIGTTEAPPLVPAHVAPPEPHTPAPVAERPPSEANTRGWMIGAGALAAALVAWLAWSWPSNTVAQTPDLAQPAPVQAAAPQPVAPAPAPVVPSTTTTPATDAQPARQTPSPWDNLFTTTLPNR